jgi:hypothetical protein
MDSYWDIWRILESEEGRMEVRDRGIDGGGGGRRV